MNFSVNGHATYCYTGGKPFDAAKPTVIFIHGVLNDHSVWILQTRYLAHHGWNVLAIDLPGHGLTAAPEGTVLDREALARLWSEGRGRACSRPARPQPYTGSSGCSAPCPTTTRTGSARAPCAWPTPASC